MKAFLTLVFIIGAVLSGTAQTNATDELAVKKVVMEFFEGISSMDETSMKDKVTPDFSLLEDGSVWNLDSLINVMQPFKSNKFQRVNKIDFISTDVQDGIAWVTYHNTANITMKDKTRTVRWLESAVLLKENGEWKIKLLHSTRVKPE